MLLLEHKPLPEEEKTGFRLTSPKSSYHQFQETLLCGFILAFNLPLTPESTVRFNTVVGPKFRREE